MNNSMSMLSECALAISSLLIVTSVTAVEPADPPAAPEACTYSYDPVVVKGEPVPDKSYVWCRPPNVQFVILYGCGSGAGGGGPVVTHASGIGDIRSGGPGGNGAATTMHVVGPLAQDRYTVLLAPASDPGENGSATIFQGADVRVSFSGAVGRNSNADAFARLVSGSSSPTAHGGATDVKNILNGRGGDAGFGPGGAGGLIGKAGSPGANCAGGGGGGFVRGPNVENGGKGGQGYLVITPVPLTFISVPVAPTSSSGAP